VIIQAISYYLATRFSLVVAASPKVYIWGMGEILQPKPVTLQEVHQLFDQELSHISDEFRPTQLPPSDVTFDQLKTNIQRWQVLRTTGCHRMQSVITYIEQHGDAVWYFADILDDIADIVQGGEMYDAEGKSDPQRATLLRSTFRSMEKQ
jgi:hypothetical protein